MTQPDTQPDPLNDLLTRIARLHQSEQRSDLLNPAQIAALDYLARANRFSRKPSSVADFLSATRGTVSQTLKALQRKGLVVEHPDPEDKRGRRYDLTQAGLQLQAELSSAFLPEIAGQTRAEIQAALEVLLLALIKAQGGKGFGLCRTCRYHGRVEGGPYCHLLSLALSEEEAGQICQEHSPQEPA